MKKKLFALLFLFLIGFGKNYCNDLSSHVNLYQQGIRDIQKKAFEPESQKEYDSLKKIFDVNDFIKLSDNIKLKAGYKLDFFLISDGYGEYPVIAAFDEVNRDIVDYLYSLLFSGDKDSIRKARIKFIMLKNFNCFKDEDYKDLPQSMHSEGCTGFLNYLEIEKTEEGILDYLTLRIMGSQFLLGWHAGYNDNLIVTSKEMMNSIMDSQEIVEFTDDERKKVLELDFEPQVTIKDDIATVRVLIFTKWGGFFEEIYKINIQDKFIIEDVKETNLLRYHCGVMY